MTGLLLGITITFLISFTVSEYVVSKQTANVEQKSGLYIFTQSKPVMQYEYIATVKSGMTASGYYDEVINSIVRKVKKDYPTADAIIFVPNAEAEVIKFK